MRGVDIKERHSRVSCLAAVEMHRLYLEESLVSQCPLSVSSLLKHGMKN